MEILDSRRLTGPNLVWSDPGAVLEVSFDPQDAGIVDLWRHEVIDLVQLAGLPRPAVQVKSRHEGAWLVVGGPIDTLYALTDLNELAWVRAVAQWRDSSTLPAPDLSEIIAALKKEANPALLALQAAARQQGVSFFWDDDQVSMGMGSGSQTWPARDLPPQDALDWDGFHDIPLAVVTGTNGKSTNVRLLSHMATCAGIMHGSTSTDWIRVGNELLDKGDYSGPGGARAVLRDKRVQMAFLETARGGLLRRGAGTHHADVSLITNVAEDHMGQYGIHTVQDLAEAKGIVRRLLTVEGTLVLNADDQTLTSLTDIAGGAEVDGGEPAICWFSIHHDNPRIVEHMSAGGRACMVRNGDIVYSDGKDIHFVASIDNVPITLGGAAGYNVSNCLSATAVALNLGIPLDDVRQGLTTFESTPETNPGRSNYFDAEGVRILLDYAHNVHGLEAILDTTSKLGANRRILTLSTAGDRTEQEIRELAAAAANSGVERIIVSDCIGYERELGKGGVPRILTDELKRHGVEAEQFDSELEAVRAALTYSRDGDLLILLVKGERNECLDLIQQKLALH